MKQCIVEILVSTPLIIILYLLYQYNNDFSCLYISTLAYILSKKIAEWLLK